MSSNSRALHKGAIFWAATICSVFLSDRMLNTEDSTFAFFLQVSQFFNRNKWQFVRHARQKRGDSLLDMHGRCVARETRWEITGTTIAKADSKLFSSSKVFLALSAFFSRESSIAFGIH